MTQDGSWHSGFRHPEAGPLSAALRRDDPSDETYTEAMLFGLGGGISFAYFAFAYGETRTLYLGAQAMSAGKGMMEAMRDAAGASGKPSAASSARAARTRIRKSLDNGVPVIAWVDPSALRYHGLAEPPAQYYTVLVHGLDEESRTVTLADLPSGFAQVSTEEFEAAHNPANPPRRQTLIVERPSSLPDPARAAHAGIRACCAQMLRGEGGARGTARNLGVAGMAQWAALMTDTRAERGWPHFFSTPSQRFRSLAAIYDQIQGVGRDGAALRPLYADFVQEAAELLQNPDLLEGATLLRESAMLWEELASTATPDEIPALAEWRALGERRMEAFNSPDGPDAQAMAGMRARRAELLADPEAAPPLADDGVYEDLLSGLASRVEAIHDMETAIFQELEQAASGA